MHGAYFTDLRAVEASLRAFSVPFLCALRYVHVPVGRGDGGEGRDTNIFCRAFLFFSCARGVVGWDTREGVEGGEGGGGGSEGGGGGGCGWGRAPLASAECICAVSTLGLAEEELLRF